MTKLTKPATRIIINDFVKEINLRKTIGPKPTKTVINFREEMRSGFEREVYFVPTELLRYRKDNGRITSEVISHERNIAKLEEIEEESQNKLQDFLSQKDKEKTEELMKSIEHEGQRDPAIITCDGFLINGNRRKMALHQLFEKTKDNKYLSMKVVILPGEGDPGGPPTLIEIEQIENRYQLQSDGKAEYTSFDKALSIKRKIDMGMSLEQQLHDNPQYIGLTEKDFSNEVNNIKEEYLKPLECIDRYLSSLDRSELYESISTGSGDREGRWQSFLDYYKSVYSKLKDSKKCLELDIKDSEKGKIEDIAFKIIRMREISDISGLNKLHQVMRQLPKWLKNADSKKELLKFAETVKMKLDTKDVATKSGEIPDHKTIDEKWRGKYKETFINHIKKALHLYEMKVVRETPISLLEGALKKLESEDMDLDGIDLNKIDEARKLTGAIRTKIDEIEKQLYQHKKNYKDFKEKFEKKH